MVNRSAGWLRHPGNFHKIRDGSELGPSYEHHAIDIREFAKLEDVFRKHSNDLKAVIHTAAQPSHDWAARDPFTDFTINANATLNLLELTRRHCPGTPFVFTSTNKVYGDTPNSLPLVEQQRRWEIAESHPYHGDGIDESMTIDQSKHSLFGASKAAADLMTQEYGRYFDMPTACFRGGCLTVPDRAESFRYDAARLSFVSDEMRDERVEIHDHRLQREASEGQRPQL